ncbi:MAG: GNAT family N-acetyltransferase [Rhodobacteraceae bacterium]|nr:GNAT family N-acetyltransferase [Paracoccaceae bacterium]
MGTQPISSNEQLSLTVLKSVSELIDCKEQWDSFVEAVGSDVYFLVDWLETWLKFYGKSCDLRCYIVKKNEQIIAVLPFCLEPLRIGFVSIRIARFVGSYGTIAVFSPPVQSGYEAQVMKIVLSSLFVAEKCDSVCLSPLSGVSRLSRIEDWNEISDGDFISLDRKDVGVHTLFELPESFDDFLTSLGKSRKKKYLYENRSLSKKFDIENRAIQEEEAIRYFDTFVDFHTELWKRTGKLGHFGDWPESLEFNRELVRRMAPNRRVKFYELSAGGSPLSMGYSFELGSTSFNRLTARDTNVDLKKFGLGRVGYMKILELLIEEGKRLEETGPGHYEYKMAIGAREYQMKRLIFTRPSSGARLKTKLYLKMSEWLHFIYYRVWFLKLSPKLGLKSKPLWAFWIKAKL